MACLAQAVKKIAGGASLTPDEARDSIVEMVHPETSPILVSAFLMGMRVKGESEDELFGCAQGLRSLCRALADPPRPLLDTCGTGGDGASTINISTLASLVVACCGIHVAKHGSRSITSRCGSADLMESLGIPLLADPVRARQCLEQHRYGFLFAPHFHPATASVGTVRRALGFRTIFNLLGPLSNPAGAQIQLIGVFAPELCSPVARVAGRLGVESCMVVHGAGQVDELTLAGTNQLSWWRGGHLQEFRLDASELGLPSAPLEALAGGDPLENARVSQATLRGEPGPASDTVALNAAAALVAAGWDWAAALQKAQAVLQQGHAWGLVERLRLLH